MFHLEARVFRIIFQTLFLVRIYVDGDFSPSKEKKRKKVPNNYNFVETDFKKLALAGI